MAVCGSEISVDNCKFMNNMAAFMGGGLFVECGSVTISNSQFIGNRADSGGGLGMCFSGYFEFTNATNTEFVGNDRCKCTTINAKIENFKNNI